MGDLERDDAIVPSSNDLQERGSLVNRSITSTERFVDRSVVGIDLI